MAHVRNSVSSPFSIIVTYSHLIKIQSFIYSKSAAFLTVRFQSYTVNFILFFEILRSIFSGLRVVHSTEREKELRPGASERRSVRHRNVVFSGHISDPGGPLLVDCMPPPSSIQAGCVISYTLWALGQCFSSFYQLSSQYSVVAAAKMNTTVFISKRKT